MKLFIATLLVLTTFAASAQTDDYVITTKGDTVKCKISFSFLGGVAKYKLPGGKAGTIYTDTIREFMSKSKELLCRAVYLDESPKLEFTKVVENGTISLYEVKTTIQTGNGASMTSTVWYAGKNSNKVSYLKTNALLNPAKAKREREADLGEMLKDKTEIYDKYIAEKKFSFKAIRKLVHLYNTGKEL